MCEHLRLSGDNCVDRIEMTLKVAHQRLDVDVRAQGVKPPNSARYVLRPTVEQIVSVDHREYDICKSENGDGACYMLWLSNVEDTSGIACGDGAESASARANLS